MNEPYAGRDAKTTGGAASGASGSKCMKNTENGKGVDVLMERLETKSAAAVK